MDAPETRKSLAHHLRVMADRSSDRIDADRLMRAAELVRADLRPKVKALVWEYHPAGTIAAPPTGHSYIIETRMKGRIYFIKGILPSPQFDTLEAAKAAAQADYELRILAALEG